MLTPGSGLVTTWWTAETKSLTPPQSQSITGLVRLVRHLPNRGHFDQCAEWVLNPQASALRCVCATVRSYNLVLRASGTVVDCFVEVGGNERLVTFDGCFMRWFPAFRAALSGGNAGSCDEANCSQARLPQFPPPAELTRSEQDVPAR